MESEITEKREIEEIEGNFMEKDKVIVEFKKFISVLEQNSSSSPSSEFIFHRYMGGEINSANTKKGEIFLILKSPITISKQELTIDGINDIFEQKIRSNSFLMPSDPEFTPILNYFFRNQDDFTLEKNRIISFLQEKIKNLQNSIWIGNHNVFSFINGNSFQPDCIINSMRKSDNIAFIFQINNLNLIFNKTQEINDLKKKISLLNGQIEQSYKIGKAGKNLEDKQVSNEKTIQKLKNKLNSVRDEFKTKISLLKQNLQRKESENNQLKSKMQDLSKSIQKLKRDNQNLIEQKEEIDEDNVLLRENLEENEDKISDLLEELKSFKDQNSHLKSSNDQLSNQIEVLKVKIRKNTSKIKDFLNEIDSF